MSKPVKYFFRRLKNFWLFRVGEVVYWGFRKGREGYTNEKEIRFVGLQRSGNHAIINWIYCQCSEPRCHLNWVKVDQNPFYCFQRRATVREFQKDFFTKFNINAEKIGMFSKKNLFMFSYEDEHLEKIVSEKFEKNREMWIGRSKKRYDLLLLRDPFNLFASRLKKEDDIIENKYSLRKESERAILSAMWKGHAKEFLGETSILKNNKVCVNYNKWVSDREYRRIIAGLLDLEFTDAGVEEVLHIGGGSSFDRIKYNQKASDMKVLERWKHYIDDDDFLDIFKDREIIDLSHKIFGEIPGTDELIKKL